MRTMTSWDDDVPEEGETTQELSAGAPMSTRDRVCGEVDEWSGQGRWVQQGRGTEASQDGISILKSRRFLKVFVLK